MPAPPPACTVAVYLPDRRLWAEAKAKATGQGLSVSRVVALLLAAYVAGDVIVNPPEIAGKP